MPANFRLSTWSPISFDVVRLGYSLGFCNRRSARRTISLIRVLARLVHASCFAPIAATRAAVIMRSSHTCHCLIRVSAATRSTCGAQFFLLVELCLCQRHTTIFDPCSANHIKLFLPVCSLIAGAPIVDSCHTVAVHALNRRGRIRSRNMQRSPNTTLDDWWHGH